MGISGMNEVRNGKTASVFSKEVKKHWPFKTEIRVEEEVNTTLGGNEVWYLPLIGLNPFDSSF
jgi:hypothetical protein